MATPMFSSLECKELNGILRPEEKKEKRVSCRCEISQQNNLAGSSYSSYLSHTQFASTMFVFSQHVFLKQFEVTWIARFCSWQVLRLSHSQTIDQHVCQHSLSRVNFVGPQR
jgi:hypothetical protein